MRTALVLTVLCLAACSSKPAGPSCTPCGSDSDCLGGEFCRRSVCVGAGQDPSRCPTPTTSGASSGGSSTTTSGSASASSSSGSSSSSTSSGSGSSGSGSSGSTSSGSSSSGSSSGSTSSGSGSSGSSGSSGGTSGTPDAGVCLIGAAVYANGEADPSNPCSVCEPAQDPTGFTTQPDGTGCGAGRTCAFGTCACMRTQMPDSPTARCVDGSDAGTVVSCPTPASSPVHGQDGDVLYGYGPLRLTYPDGGGGAKADVFFDGHTGLWWTQDLSASAVDRPGAQTYCAGLTQDGWTDWQVPTANELVSAGDYGSSNPFLVLPLPSDGGDVWAADLSSDGGFGLSAIGRIDHLAESGLYPVRCVRRDACTEPQRFVADAQNEVVLDLATGLHWERDTNAAGAVSWADAVQTCGQLSLGGVGPGGWRLPSVKELLSIVDHTRHAPSIDPIFSTTQSDDYWAATPRADLQTYAWKVRFEYGSSFAGHYWELGWVRCVY